MQCCQGMLRIDVIIHVRNVIPGAAILFLMIYHALHHWQSVGYEWQAVSNVLGIWLAASIYKESKVNRECINSVWAARNQTRIICQKVVVEFNIIKIASLVKYRPRLVFDMVKLTLVINMYWKCRKKKHIDAAMIDVSNTIGVQLP